MISRPGLQILPNQLYQHPRRTVMRTRDQDCWSFSCEGIEGANLLDAYEGKLRGLDGKEDLLFPADFVKVTFLVAIHGCKQYRRVKNVQRSRGGVPLPTLRYRVVECIAETMVAFLKQVKVTDEYDCTVAFGPAGIQLKDLYLLELRRYGKTLLPVFGYILPGANYVAELDWPNMAAAFALAWDDNGNLFCHQP